MEAFSEPCAWHPSPDLASNAMPYPFLIQVPLPDLFSSCAAAYYLRDTKSLLLGSTIKQTHCILKCVFHHNTKGQFPRFYNKVQNSYFTSTTLTFFFLISTAHNYLVIPLNGHSEHADLEDMHHVFLSFERHLESSCVSTITNN